jgi:RHS repeat-associated protein
MYFLRFFILKIDLAIAEQTDALVPSSLQRAAVLLNLSTILPNTGSPRNASIATSGNGDLNFTGDYQDLFSGLYDPPNREFDTSSGSRWLSPDPARASWNAYSYATNPNSFVDPLGLDPHPTTCKVIGGCSGSGSDCEGINPMLGQ